MYILVTSEVIPWWRTLFYTKHPQSISIASRRQAIICRHSRGGGILPRTICDAGKSLPNAELSEVGTRRAFKEAVHKHCHTNVVRTFRLRSAYLNTQCDHQRISSTTRPDFAGHCRDWVLLQLCWGLPGLLPIADASSGFLGLPCACEGGQAGELL